MAQLRPELDSYTVGRVPSSPVLSQPCTILPFPGENGAPLYNPPKQTSGSVQPQHANPNSYLFQDPARTPGPIPTSTPCRGPLAQPRPGQPITAEQSQAHRRKPWHQSLGHIFQPHLWRGKHRQGC